MSKKIPQVLSGAPQISDEATPYPNGYCAIPSFSVGLLQLLPTFQSMYVRLIKIL